MTPIEQEIAEKIQSGELAPEDALSAVEQMMADPETTDPEALAEQERKAAEDRRQRLSALGHRLHNDAQTQVGLRQTTEERWYQDVRQFNGQYDPGTFSDSSQYGSRVFVPLTRRLVNLCEARLFDMLFPSDQRFYVTEPTPVPDMDQADQLASQLPPDHPVQMPGGQQLQAGAVQAAVKQLMEEAKTRNDAMQREIDDQLAECKFAPVARDAIHDAVLLGTGVLKGPVPMIKATKRWTIDPETNSHVLFMEKKPVPVTVRVDLWNFFPDMSATNIADCEAVYERHFLTKRQVADLQNMPDVDKDALREILGAEPTTPLNNYRERLRSINGATGAPDKRYEIWEYHGPIDAQDLIDCGCEIDDEDPLTQYTGIVWFCEGVVFKAAINPMDSGELPYRVFNWQKDESSIFGFGLPYEVRDQQVSANSSWRAMHDNMGLCVMPQVVIDEGSIEPVDGSYGVAPGKFWRNKRPGSDARQGIQFVEINSRLGELQSIFAASKSLIEEVGTMPGFMQGQDAPSKMQSATEASIAWTAANLWVRRCVRNWDDDVTTPMISGYYDYNMQWSEKEDIKGDSKVRALGIAALVELEGQAGRMQQLANAASAMGLPLSTNYAMLRELCRSLKLDPDRWLPSEQDIAKMKAEEAKQGPKVDIEQEKVNVQREAIQSKEKIAAIQLQGKERELAQREKSDQNRMELELADTAAKEQITAEQARLKYTMETERISPEMADRQENRAHKAQMLNAEMALKAQLGSGV
jgi:hypothetical protein